MSTRQTAADALPPFSRRFHALFARYLRRYFARHFNAVRINRQGLPPSVPPPELLVVFSNHPGWWDPMLFILLGRLYYPDREGYGPMDAEALRRYGFLRRLGVFGVDQDSRRGAAQFLRQGAAALSRGGVLWLTAEGAFSDPRRRPVSLQPGLAHLAQRVGPVRVIPLAIEYPFWSERAPEALVSFGEALEVGGEAGRDELQRTQRRLEAALEATMDALAASAMERDPAGFHTLVDGRKGVGGSYDLARCLKAWWRGQRFEAAHMQSEDTPTGDHPK